MALYLLTINLLTACTPFSVQTSSSSQIQVQQEPRARLTYVAIGASDTYGIGATDPTTQNWPLDLAHKMGSGVRLVNLGIPGIDAHAALQSELPVALDEHSDVVTVWLAVNDLMDKVPVNFYQRDLDTLLTRLHAASSHALIAVANVPDLTLLPFAEDSNMQELRSSINSYNTAIANVVQRHHVVLVDLYQQGQTLAEHPDYISDDGLHPSSLGYTQVAETFYRTLQMHKL